MKKGDYVIISAVLIAALISGALLLFGGKNGSKVVISKNNETVFEGDLNGNKTVDLESNVVVIKDGKVYVENAECSNQICVNHKAISKKGESIACLPNKVLVEIK